MSKGADEKKKAYVLIEMVASDCDRNPKINGYDIYLTDWQSWGGMLGAALEDISHGKSVTVKLTLLEMTDAEYEEYIEEHEIDMGDY